MTRELKGSFGGTSLVPDVNLKEEPGKFLKGKLKWRGQVGEFKTVKYLFELIDTNASTILYDSNTKIRQEVDVNVGDTVGLLGSVILNDKLSEAHEGDILTITYEGRGKKGKRPNPPHLFKVVLED